MTPCIAALISSGRIPIAASDHLVPGARPGGLEEDLLHAERDRHARSAGDVENEGLGEILGKPLAERRTELRSVGFLKGNLVGTRRPGREVDSFQLVSLVSHQRSGEGYSPVVLEVAQDSLGSPF